MGDAGAAPVLPLQQLIDIKQLNPSHDQSLTVYMTPCMQPCAGVLGSNRQMRLKDVQTRQGQTRPSVVAPVRQNHA